MGRVENTPSINKYEQLLHEIGIHENKEERVAKHRYKKLLRVKRKGWGVKGICCNRRLHAPRTFCTQSSHSCPGPISQNEDFYSNDASSAKKSWFQISVKSVKPLSSFLPIPNCVSIIMVTITRVDSGDL